MNHCRQHGRNNCDQCEMDEINSTMTELLQAKIKSIIETAEIEPVTKEMIEKRLAADSVQFPPKKTKKLIKVKLGESVSSSARYIKTEKENLYTIGTADHYIEYVYYEVED